jgi:hypothetical protein
MPYPSQGSSVLMSSLDAVAGTKQVASAPSQANQTSVAYVKVKEILIGRTGIYTVAFGLWTSNASYPAFGRIYKNGVAFGTERTTAATGEQTYSENLAFNRGDLLQLYVHETAGSYMTYAHLLVYELCPVIPTIVLDT